MKFYTKSLFRPRAGMAKILLVMRLIIVLLTTAIIKVSAAGYAQKITLTKNNESIIKVFNEIRNQSGYDFVFTTSLLETAKAVSINVKGVELKDVLDKIFTGQPLSYTIEDKTVMVKKKEPSFLERIVDRLAAIDVRGRLVDVETGEGLIGATVKVKGTNKQTSTNGNGEFYLENVAENSVLQITFLGYKTREVKAETQLGEIKMELGISDLDEVTVSTGYWQTTKAKSIGNIVSISGDDLKDQPLTSPLMGLQGRAAGVDVYPNSGVPGSGTTIRIRGRNSLRFDGSFPLYVIDGVPVDASPVLASSSLVAGHYDPLASLNPADIKSIDILKDADATAIYGSRGANGVVLITTRMGAQGKTVVDFNLTRGAGRVPNKLDLLNTREYLTMRREAFRNNNNEEINEFNAPDIMLWDTTQYTDWQDLLIGNTSDITTVQAGISGGGANTSFRLNGGFHKETTVFPGDFNFRRSSGSFSLNHLSSNKKLRVNATANYGVTRNYLAESPSAVVESLRLAPNAPAPYNPDGTLNWELNSSGGSSWTNPLADFNKINNTQSGNLMLNTSINYEFNNLITAKVNAGYTDMSLSEILTVPLTSFDPLHAIYYTPQRQWTTTQRRSWIVEPQVLLSRTFNSHTIEAVIGSTFQEGSSDVKNIWTDGYPSDALLNSFHAAGFILVQRDDQTKYRYNSVFARVGYNLRETYLLNLTARRDGSSRFGQNNRFGDFGSVGAGWIFSKESLVAEKLPFISFGKLRASYGITGNDQIGDYRYINTYRATSGRYQGAFGLVPTALYNPDYKWEKSKKMEAALELSLFRDRMSMEIAWFRHRSSNLIIDYQLPGASGFTSILKNLDAVIENRGLELTASYKLVNKGNFWWSINGNYSRPRNELMKFEGLEASSYASNWIIGEPLSVSRMYKYTGVDPETGFYTFLDVNGDGNLGVQDQIEIRNVGRTYFGGIGNDISFKGFELSFLFQFVTQTAQSFFPGVMPGSTVGNVPQEWYQNRWINTGDDSEFQKVTTDPNALNDYHRLSASDYTVEDASFLRLKTLSFSYSLAAADTKRMKLSQLRIFMQGQNLFTITKYSGLDPETFSGTLPPLRMLTFGLQLGI